MKKFIALAVVAALAISAVAASAASAAPDYKSSVAAPGKTFLTAFPDEGVQTFQAGTVPVKCNTVSGKGSFVSGDTSITVEDVTYSGDCTVAGQAATVNFRGCDYTFGAATGGPGTYTLTTITIGNETGKNCAAEPILITATTAGCTITVGPQTTHGESTLTNLPGPPKDVTLKAKVGTPSPAGITYTSSGGICGAKGTRSDGVYTGNTTIKGYSDEAHTKQVDIFVE